MRHLRFIIVSMVFTGLVFGLIPKTWAVEEGQLLKKDGRWEYMASEDPGLKYLLLKNVISQEEYDKGLRVLETRERISKPNFTIDVNNGLNIRVGSKFLLKMRLLTQVRYSFSQYNEAWGTVGDSRNPEILGGQVEFRGIKNASDSSTFMIPQAQLQFMGHAFDPDLRYNFSVQLNQNAFNQEGGSGRASLVDAYIGSWHVPFATIQVGQQKVWFNRALISAVATSSFADNMLVQRTFAANLINSRDIGIVVLSDEEKYKFNYVFGIWGGVGPNLTNEGTSVSQALPNNASLPASQQRTFNYDTRFRNGEMMYTARLLYKFSGNPGYGQGDILNSRVPQVAIGAGYAYNPAQNYLSSIRSDIVGRAYRQGVTNGNNGRLLGGGVYDFQTYEVDLIAKYQGWSLQSEGYYRHQHVRTTDDGSIPFTPATAVVLGPPVDLGQAWGWYVQVGKYIIPRKLELAVRYAVLDPSTKQKDDLTKEFGAALSYSFDGTYNNRLLVDYSHLTLGSGGRAPDRFPFESVPGFGQDLVENRINVQYQFYF